MNIACHYFILWHEADIIVVTLAITYHCITGVSIADDAAGNCVALIACNLVIASIRPRHQLAAFTCRKTGIQPQPPCSVIPLGTGNGMSVNLGWGHRASRRWVRDRHSMADVRLPSCMHAITHAAVAMSYYGRCKTTVVHANICFFCCVMVWQMCDYCHSMHANTNPAIAESWYGRCEITIVHACQYTCCCCCVTSMAGVKLRSVVHASTHVINAVPWYGRWEIAFH